MSTSRRLVRQRNVSSRQRPAGIDLLWMLNEMATKIQRPSVSDKRREFRALHQQGCFVLPTPWDVGSARMLQHLGFPGLTSTSTGFAWATGRPDYAVCRTEVLRHLTALCLAVDIRVNADFESGFARDPEGVAVNVRLALDAGVAGLSIKDRNLDGSPEELYDVPEAVKRVKAAPEARCICGGRRRLSVRAGRARAGGYHGARKGGFLKTTQRSDERAGPDGG